MENIHNLLKEEFDKYEILTNGEWKEIKSKFSLLKIKKGNYFLEEGQICRKLGFVIEGFLRTYNTNELGDELTTHFAHINSFAVSFYSFKHQIPSFESIKALEDSQLLVIDHTSLQDLFNISPKWHSIYRNIIENAYACMEERNYILQNMSASKKYELLIQQAHPDFIKKVQLGYIASYLGIKQETLSRIRKSLTLANF